MCIRDRAYASYIGINEEINTNKLRFAYYSMVTPESIFDYNMDSGKMVLKKQQKIVGGYDQNLYQDEIIYACLLRYFIYIIDFF